MIRKSLTLVVAMAVLCTSAVQANEVFEFSTISDGAGFNGLVDAPSNSGDYFFSGGGFMQENASVVFMFQDDAVANGTINPIASNSFVLNSLDEVQSFSINSLDWRAFGANGGNTATLIGLSDGGTTEAWRITGPQDIDPPTTYTAPTTGSFATLIDTFRWDIPDYADGTFGHTLDNLDVNVGSGPPPSGDELFQFSTVSDGAGFNGMIDAPSDSGNFTLTTTLPSILQENGNGTSGTVFMYESGGPGGARTAELNVLNLADVAQTFSVSSVDWRAAAAAGGSMATLTGFSGGSGGTQQWQLAGPEEVDPPATFTSPTTGSFDSEIDTIVWSIPSYVDGAFGNTLDNLLIDFGSSSQDGDLTGDGDVDGLDFLEWQRTDRTAATLALIQDNYGTTASVPSAAAVPEPSTLLLLSLSLACVPRRRRL